MVALHNIPVILVMLFALSLEACSKGTKVLSMDKNAIGADRPIEGAVNSDKSVSGMTDAAYRGNQYMTTSPDSAAGGAQVMFPMGSLAISSAVSLGGGASLARSDIASGLGIATTFQSSGASVSVGSNPAQDMLSPFVLSIPLPTSLTLTQNNDLLILIYEEYRAATNSYVTGIVTAESLVVDGNMVKYQTKYFGTYQTAYTKEKITAPVSKTGSVKDVAKTIAVDTIAPTVVSVTSTAADGLYAAGQEILIDVKFTEIVQITGTPSLSLNTLPTSKTASYVSGSGSDTLRFSYTVSSVDSSTRLDYSSTTALLAVGGTITDAAGNHAVLTLAAPGQANSLSVPANIKVMGNAARIISVTTVATGYKKTADVIVIDVNFDQDVTVVGTPVLYLNLGNGTRAASYTAGGGTTNKRFMLTVAAGDQTSDLDYVSSSSLSLEGGSILDASSNGASLILPAPGSANSLAGTSSVVVDTIAPVAPVLADATKYFNASFNTTMQQGTPADANFMEFRYTQNGSTPDCGTGNPANTSPAVLNIAASTQTLRVVACDAAGNMSPETLATYTFDNTAPTVNLGSPSPSSAGAATTVTLNVSYPGADTVSLSNADISFGGSGVTVSNVVISGAGNSRTVSLSGFSGSGTVTVSIAQHTASDFAGNLAPSAGPSSPLTVDAIAPTLAFQSISPASGQSSTQPMVTATVSEPSDITLYSDSSCTTASSPLWSGSSGPRNLTMSPQIQGTTIAIYARAVDAATNTSPCTQMQGSYNVGNPIANMTQGSPQRRTFFDGSRHWAFWLTPAGIAYGFSADGNSFKASGLIAGTDQASAFSVAFDQSSRVVVVFERDFSIKVASGAIATTSIGWTNAILMSGSGSTPYTRPSIAYGADGKMHVAAFYANISGAMNTPRSTSLVSPFTAAGSFSNIGSDSTANPESIMLVSTNTIGSPVRAFVSSGGGAVRHYVFGAGSWSLMSGETKDWDFVAGVNGVAGTVNAMMLYKGDLVVAGSFSSVAGMPVPSIARWNGSNWSSIGSGLGVGAIIKSLAVDTNNVLYAAGYVAGGGVVAKWDGSAWTSITPAGMNYSSALFALKLAADDAGKVYLVGKYTSSFDNYVLRWDTTTSSWSSIGFTSAVSSVTNVTSVAVYQNKIYIGGVFTGSGISNVAQWDNATWSGVGGLSSTINALAVDPTTGFLHAGGSFTGNVAQWNGTIWTTVGSIGGAVNTLAFDRDGVLYGGTSTLKRYSGSWVSVGSAVSGIAVNAVVIDPRGSVYAGGDFSAVGSVAVLNIAQFSVANNAWSPLSVGFNGPVLAITRDTWGNIYVAGDFSRIGGLAVNNIAKWDGHTWYAVGTGLNFPVYALAADSSGSVYAGGNFTNAGGTAAYYVAKWDGSSWAALGSGTNGPVYALAVNTSNQLYAGGNFNTAGGGGASYVAKWDGASWSALGSGTDATVNALVVDHSDNLYVGGSFGFAGGIANQSIAKWTGGSWASAMAGGPSGTVSSLAVDSVNNVYAGGALSGGFNFVAKWDNIGWSTLGTGLNNPVNALAVDSNDYVYAAGSLITLAGGGVTVQNIAVWNGAAWSATNSGLGSVYALYFDPAKGVLAGGPFGFARYASDLMVKTSSFSVASAGDGVALAYIHPINGKPYGNFFNGSVWGTPSAIYTLPSFGGSIAIASDSTGANRYAVWDLMNGLKAATYNGTWGNHEVIGASGAAFPTLAEELAGTMAIIWSKGQLAAGAALQSASH